MAPMAAGLFCLLINDPGQQQVNPYCDQSVTQSAQWRVEAIVKRGYFAHVAPDDWAPIILSLRWLHTALLLPGE